MIDENCPHDEYGRCRHHEDVLAEHEVAERDRPVDPDDPAVYLTDLYTGPPGTLDPDGRQLLVGYIEHVLADDGHCSHPEIMCAVCMQHLGGRP